MADRTGCSTVVGSTFVDVVAKTRHSGETDRGTVYQRNVTWPVARPISVRRPMQHWRPKIRVCLTKKQQTRSSAVAVITDRTA